MSVYYNENDRHAAAWLRELIKSGLIAPGEVDERDIRDVAPTELVGFTQHHWFAGIGVWSRALRRGGWSDSRNIWTGSCPCTPFSSAGKRTRFNDERHLWPAWYWLICQHRPDIIVGEQVSSAGGLAWLDLVAADLEAEGYTIGVVDISAAGIGAPHVRHRLYWIAHRLANPGGKGLQVGSVDPQLGGAVRDQGDAVATSLVSGGMAYSQGLIRGLSERPDGSANPEPQRSGETFWAGAVNGFWRNADWLFCQDGRWRPVESGTSPMVAGPAKRVVRGGDQSAPLDAQDTAEARVMRLRGYGNAITAGVAEAFIRSVMEIL